ncbi:MAG: hypothetical protein V1873_08430 [Verrucomicrobiota bacterium]
MNKILPLLKKDLRSFANLLRLVREESLFKIGFILMFAAALLLGLWALFLEGFQFLDSLGGIGLMLVYRLFALFFFGVGVMLVLSSVITSYTTFFRSEETAFLLLKPMTRSEVTVYKSLHAAVLASWAFFFTIIPFVGAYAWHEHLPIFFSVWTLLFSIPLVLLCSGIGSIVCLLVARWLPRVRWLVWPALAALLIAGWRTWRRVVVSVGVEDETALMLNQLIPGLRVASYPLWPSWWVSEGIMALTRGQWGRGLMFLGVLVSNMLMVGLVVHAMGRRLFYDGWQRAQYSRGATKRTGVLLRPLEQALGFLAADVRAMVLKDIRVFFRDVAQWSQGLVFFGLLALYFLNLRNLHYHVLPAEWRNLIAFLNVFSVSAVLCSFGSRFVYPQLSLEGHGFWVIGLSPTTMGRVLAAKFGLALTGMTLISAGLMALSTRMLLVPPAIQAAAVCIALAMSLGISGLSTGLGAVFLDLKQTNPVAIVSGFGGTLNLALSLLLMGLIIVPFGVIFHLHYLGHLPGAELPRGLAVAALWTAAVTAVATLVPLTLARRSLQRREY